MRHRLWRYRLRAWWSTFWNGPYYGAPDGIPPCRPWRRLRIWLRYPPPIHRLRCRYLYWRARRVCDRVGHDTEGGASWHPDGTNYWWQCKRCGDGDSSL